MSFINDTASGESLRSTGNSVPMSAKEFRLLSGLVESSCGIRMPESKRTMLESRLQKRLRSLELRSFKAYFDLLVSPAGRRHELIRMIDAVTTNKTDFFREPAHFRYLTGKVLPETVGKGACDTFRAWSAGCSSGEEAYTLAMVLSEYAADNQPFPFSILATDICTTVLEKACRGVYEEEKITPVPEDLRRKYLLRSRDRSRGMVRISPELRSQVKFRRLNFMDDTFTLYEPMHIIFCRNVLIYFDRMTQEKLLNKFCGHLVPGGYLFLGHSETINGMYVPLIQVDSTIYRKPR
jgi:chemotaxis protein methyltransferase CheR